MVLKIKPSEKSISGIHSKPGHLNPGDNNSNIVVGRHSIVDLASAYGAKGPGFPTW